MFLNYSIRMFIYLSYISFSTIHYSSHFKVISASWEGTGARKQMLPVESIYSNNFKVCNLVQNFCCHFPMLFTKQLSELFCRNNEFSSFQVMWDFDGFFRYSPMFYGYYSKKNERGGYNIPLAYFCAEMIVYIFRYATLLYTI